MTDTANTEDDGHRRQVKVARLIDEYELTGLGSELERRWTADEDRMSLRELATFFNQKLLAEALDETDERPLRGELEHLYRLLVNDEESTAEQTRARRRLKRAGVDVESLRGDFVSYQAIRTYLKRDRSAESPTDETDPLERAEESLQRLQGRTVTVAESKLEQLQDGGHLTLGDTRTTVDIRVMCETCGGQYTLRELFDQGGCNC
jgi:hypothetical protein